MPPLTQPITIADARNCAIFFQDEFINKLYRIETLNGNVFWLESIASNFPHLIGIKRGTYTRYGYYTGELLFNAIINNDSIHRNVLPMSIQATSLKGKKIKNFTLSNTIFTDVEGLCLQYDSSKNSFNLDNVDYLLTNYKTGLSMGWALNSQGDIFQDKNIGIYRPVSWIDELNGTNADKEKYYPNQATELIKNIKIYDKLGILISRNKVRYTYKLIKEVIEVASRNQIDIIIKDNRLKFIIISLLLGKSVKINGKIYKQ